MGIGRVDIAPKYQAVELVAFTALTWAGAKLAGIKGVAAASALRLVAFSVFLMAASFRPGRIRFGLVWRNGLRQVLAALALFTIGLAANAVVGGGIIGAGALIILFGAGSFSRLLDRDEKAFIVGLLRRRRARPPAGAAGTEGRG
jgi:O-antigen/teichoic acid export membrane protein